MPLEYLLDRGLRCVQNQRYNNFEHLEVQALILRVFVVHSAGCVKYGRVLSVPEIKIRLLCVASFDIFHLLIKAACSMRKHSLFFSLFVEIQF